MGRTDMGEWSSWRASNWSVIWMMRGDGKVWDIGDHEDLCDETLTTSLNQYVLTTIIPQSEALAIWPDVPPDSIHRDGSELCWTAWQHKASALKFAAIVTISLIIGVGVSCALVTRSTIRLA